jgi:CheY-like chemotaxis protein
MPLIRHSSNTHMNRVLIVAGERQTGERYQQALGQEGFQTAVVWNPIQMVEFCRQHTPDFMVVDLDLAELGLWSSLQAVRGIGTLANVHLLGLSSTANQQLFEKAKAAGFLAVFPTYDSSRAILESIKREIQKNQEPEEISDEVVFSRDPSLNRLREIALDIVQVSASLKSRIGEYGEDGPELFSYIVNSGHEIRKKLNGTADFSLHDKELRHDFRNMIGSVTGFSELILMEVGLSPESTAGLTRLRENSSEFVHILDQQKAGVTA